MPIKLLEIRIIQDLTRAGSTSLMWRSIEDGTLVVSASAPSAMLRLDIDFVSDETSTVNLIGAIDGSSDSGLHVTQTLELRVSSGESGTATLSFNTIAFATAGTYTVTLSVPGRADVWSESLRVDVSG